MAGPCTSHDRLTRPATMRYGRSQPTPETLAIEARVKAAGEVLKTFPKTGPFNLTPETVRHSAEYRMAKAAYDAAFTALRAHNAARLARD